MRTAEQASNPMKAIVKIPHVSWRDGRPRFNPGPELRAMGFRGEDLKTPGGAWFSLRACEDWAIARDAEIRARKSAGSGKITSGKIIAGSKASPRTAAQPQAFYTIEQMFHDLFASRKFRAARTAGGLSPKTVQDYRNKSSLLMREHPHFAASAAAAVTAPVIIGLHEEIWEQKSLGMASAMIAVLSAAWFEAVRRGKASHNPCHGLRLPKAEGRLRIWTPEEAAAMMAAADDPAHGERAEAGDAIMLALYTCQRAGDVLALEERAEEDGRIRFIQSKTAARVRVPALPALRDRLAQARARKAARGHSAAPTVITDRRKAARANDVTMSYDRLNDLFGQIRAAAARAAPSCAALKFLDLRDTGVTRLANAGCTMAEICSISGHSSQSVTMIMKHYLELNTGHADAATTKLQAWLDQEGIAV